MAVRGSSVDRYSASGLPDATVDPYGKLVPLRSLPNGGERFLIRKTDRIRSSGIVQVCRQRIFYRPQMRGPDPRDLRNDAGID
jgi:hypothetical protein